MINFFSEDLTQDELALMFQSDEKCLEFISTLKWGKDLNAENVATPTSAVERPLFFEEMYKVKSEESATAGTIFHNCKFPISKAFYIAFQVCKGNETISTYEFARRLSLRQMTCWNFKSKISSALDSLTHLSDDEKKDVRKLFTY